MRFTDPFCDGSFTRRINRFLASIRIDGREEHAHIPNSGRMGELLTLGRPIRLRERSHQGRKTQYDLSLVHCNGRWVSIDPNEALDPCFAEALNTAYHHGLKVFAFNCEVTEEGIALKDRVSLVFSP